MSRGDLGFLVSRALAALFGLYAIYIGLSSIVWVLQWNESRRPDWQIFGPILLQPVVYGVAAALLWIRADRFVGIERPAPETPPLDSSAAMRVILGGICLFVMSQHLAPVINWAWRLFAPVESDQWLPRTYTPGDIVTFFVALIAIPIVYGSRWLKRILAYPRYEDFEPEDPTS